MQHEWENTDSGEFSIIISLKADILNKSYIDDYFKVLSIVSNSRMKKVFLKKILIII
jgi:hypothetical protein